VKNTSPSARSGLRLIALYVGVIAFALAAAWGSSAGFASVRIPPAQSAARITFAPSLQATRATLRVVAHHYSAPSSATALSVSRSPGTNSPDAASPHTSASVSPRSVATHFVPVTQNVDVVQLPSNDGSTSDSNSSDQVTPSSTSTTTTTVPTDG